MGIERIIKYPASSLRERAQAVGHPLSEELLEHIRDRVFVTRDEVYVNPIWDAHGDETEVANEGCLSFPGVYIPVTRYYHVQIRYCNEAGFYMAKRVEGLEARMVQHECDHLDGKLFIEQLPIAKRAKIKADMIRRKLSGRA
jgi:peptide deformylase